MNANAFDSKATPFGRVTGRNDWYRSERFGAAVDTLREAVSRAAGTLLLTGDGGVGKSSVVAVLEHALTPRVHFGRFHPRIFSVRFDGPRTQEWLESSVLRQVEVESAVWIAQAIRGMPESSTSLLMVVDDANDLSDIELGGLVNAARRLRSGIGGLQLLLVGDTRLEERLRRAPLIDLAGRMDSTFRLEGLSDREIRPYVDFAMTAAGYARDDFFTRDAISAIAELSGGNPRLVNSICGAALLVAHEGGGGRVARATIEECLDDLLLPAGKEDLCTCVPPGTSDGSETDFFTRQDRQLDLDLGEAADVRRFRDPDKVPAAGPCDIRTTPFARVLTIPLVRKVPAWISVLAKSAWTRARSRFSDGIDWIDRRVAPARIVEVVRGWQRPPRIRAGDLGVPTAWSIRFRRILTKLRSNGAMAAQVTFAFGLFLMAITVWVLVLSLDGPRSAGESQIASASKASGGQRRADKARDARVLDAVDSRAESLLTGASSSNRSDLASGQRPLPGARTNGRESPRDATRGEPSMHGTSGLAKLVALGETSGESIVPVSAKPVTYGKAGAPRLATVPTRMSAGPGARSGVSPATAEPMVNLSEIGAARESGIAKTPYTVSAGDTLWGVAMRHGTTVDALRAANGLGETAVIHPGKKLVIPMTAEEADDGRIWHTVEAGETLFRIGKHYGVSVAQLQSWNDLANGTNLKVGQRLRVRAGDG